jgi:hypothetical protein
MAANEVLSAPVIEPTAMTSAAVINPAIKPYSMAVTPLFSLRKRCVNFFIFTLGLSFISFLYVLLRMTESSARRTIGLSFLVLRVALQKHRLAAGFNKTDVYELSVRLRTSLVNP